MSMLTKRREGLSLLILFMMLVPSLLGLIPVASAAAPVCTVVWPTNGGYWDHYKYNATYKITVTDADSDPMDVSFYASGAIIKTVLAVPDGTTLYCAMGFVPANYTAYSWRVYVNDGTTNVSNNYTFTGESKDADVDRSGWVNQTDLDMINWEYGNMGTPRWIREDVVANGAIDITDFSVCSAAFGSVYTVTYTGPTAFTATPGIADINLSWTKGTRAQRTVIRANFTNITSWTRTGGWEIYNGTGTYYDWTGPAQNRTYYFAAWSWNQTIGLYSPHTTATAKTHTTTGSALPPIVTGVASVSNATYIYGEYNNSIAINWTKPAGTTTADYTLLFYDTVNHPAWNRSTGTLLYNDTGTSYTFWVPWNFSTTFYFCLYTWNSTYNWYSFQKLYSAATIAKPVPKMVTNVSHVVGIEDFVIYYTRQASSNVNADYVICRYDITNHTPWLISNGFEGFNVSDNGMNEWSTLGGLEQGVYYYFALFSYNSTLNTYNTTGAYGEDPTLNVPFSSLLSFTARNSSWQEIILNWTKGPGVDKVYVEFTTNVIATWTIGMCPIAYNGTASGVSLDGLFSNTRYYFCAWTWSDTYRVFNRTGVKANARTGTLGVQYIGDLWKDKQTIAQAVWANIIYPRSWRDISYSPFLNTGIFSGTTTMNAYLDGLDFSNKVPLSWYSYWMDGTTTITSDNWVGTRRIKDHENYQWTWTSGKYKQSAVTTSQTTWPSSFGAAPSLTNSGTTSDTARAWWCFDAGDKTTVSWNYGTPIHGLVTGIGIYFYGDNNHANAYNRSTKTKTLHIDHYPSGAEIGFPSEYSGSSSRTKMAASLATYSLKINDKIIGCAPSNGDLVSGTNEFLYWDLAGNSQTVFIDGEKIDFRLLMNDPGSYVGIDNSALETIPRDLDGDGDISFFTATGSAAVSAFNSVNLSGDSRGREFCYFFIYDPDSGGDRGTGATNETFVGTDVLFITPSTVGQYQTTNIIFLLSSIQYPTYLTIMNVSGGIVYNKTLEIGTGNVFYTPTEFGQYTVNLTRNGVLTTAGVFTSLAQSTMAYMYTDQNPAIKGRAFNLRVAYKITSYPAILRIKDSAGVVVKQQSVPANTTTVYDYSVTLTKSGRYTLELSQMRPYDEQIVSTYILWVKDSEYTTLVTLSKSQPETGDVVTIGYKDNIIGIEGMQLRVWDQKNDKFVLTETIGNDYIGSTSWSVGAKSGKYDVRLYCTIPGVTIPNSGILASIGNVSVTTKIPGSSGAVEEPPVIDVPSLINRAGGFIGITNPAFKLILGCLIVVAFLFIPMLLFRKAKLKYLSILIGNPLVFCGMLFIGALIAYALGLFEMWVFFIFGVIAAYFLIKEVRSSRSHGSGD